MVTNYKKLWLLVFIVVILISGCQTQPVGDTADLSGQPWYNVTGNFTGATDLLGILRYSNSITQNWWGTLTVFGVLITFFIVFKYTYETKYALLASSFIFTITAILMRIINLISEWVILVGIVLTAGTLISTLYDRLY